MKFGPVPVEKSLGAILGHSLIIGAKRLRKGCRITATDIENMQIAGIETVTVAILDHTDIDENRAAGNLAHALVPDPEMANLSLGAAFAGRVNIFSTAPGLLEINHIMIQDFNSISPDITVATLPAMARVKAGGMVATVKIIPYAISKPDLDAAQNMPALKVLEFGANTASLIMTKTTGISEKLLIKGQNAVARRLDSMNCELLETRTVAHETDTLAGAIGGVSGNIIFILTGSATSDIHDVGPVALRQAGGEIIRFGMPVDPGNLLFLGKFGKRHVIGLPGCARSLALNGADWIIQRILAGKPPDDSDIAKMGVGGLLKEIPTRPQPRARTAPPEKTPRLEIILLAAGGSKRMRGGDKLLEPVEGEPLLRRNCRAALDAGLQKVHVVLQPENPNRNAALKGLDANLVLSAHWRHGMAASIKAGMGALSNDCDGVIIALADMPEISSAHFIALASAFDPQNNRDICRAVTATGVPGLPVLFGSRFFETLSGLTGDRGARDVIRAAPEFVVNVKTPGPGAMIDLDTPEEWAEWRRKQQ